MIVVSDTSPINYLVLIEFQDLLPKLFDRVLIPEAVHRELQSDAAPDPIKRFLAEAPLGGHPKPAINRHLKTGN
jgi:predicted nucleic acid-binding protein